MIPQRYREVLPPHWYENEIAEWHFGIMEEAVDTHEAKLEELQGQFLLQRATWGISVWEWMYFHQVQSGTLEQRREAIRRKRLAKRPFTLPALRQMGAQYGKLQVVVEKFEDKEIHFEYAANAPINVNGLQTDFEYVRPVHIKQAVTVAKPITEQIAVKGSAYQHTVDYPICGLEMPQEIGVSGTLAAETMNLAGQPSYYRIDSPIAGFEIPMKEGTT
ncbi:hypothetical protein Q5741_18625 [Paenibacillus sp. JX-17]|uniref:DUF2313 domain-containing protein n=1 Tax=Paenibacillus lacisoli TaxID=3064525 RepID=A0ABT9CGL3_9BACL|nr:putative phage tail protein [Paenibacillus sp. JX-17]MDO7908419.1 hypothetical protein [Paenibacillus sp. JX-17]